MRQPGTSSAAGPPRVDAARTELTEERCWQPEQTRNAGAVHGGQTTTDYIAEQLRARGHDVTAVIEQRALTSLPDEAILGVACDAGRALVTMNIKDFVPLDQRAKESGRNHPGLVLVSAKTSPQDRSFIGAVVGALDKLLKNDLLPPGGIVFLER